MALTLSSSLCTKGFMKSLAVSSFMLWFRSVCFVFTNNFEDSYERSEGEIKKEKKIVTEVLDIALDMTGGVLATSIDPKTLMKGYVKDVTLFLTLETSTAIRRNLVNSAIGAVIPQVVFSIMIINISLLSILEGLWRIKGEW